MAVDQPLTPDTTTDAQRMQPQAQPQIAMSNADDSSNGVSVANQAPAYGDPGQPAAPAAPAPARTPTPDEQHTGWFHGMLARMNQGDRTPMRDSAGRPLVDPATGQVRTQPLSSKQLGRSILASALAAMAATEQHQPYRNGNGIWVNPSNEAVAAGQQAFQAGRPRNQLEQASKELNDQRTRQYSIYKANVDQFKMAHEIADMKFADGQKAVAGFASGYEAALRGDFGDGVSPETLDLVGDDAAKAFSELDPTTHMMVPNGKVTQHVDAAGNPTGGIDYHYMILPGQNGKVTLDEGMIKAAGLDGKNLVPGQTRIPVSQWGDLVRQQAGRHIVESAIKQVAETTGGKPVEFDYPKFAKTAQLTPAQMSELQGLDRNNPVAYQAGLAKINGESSGHLQQALEDQGIKIDAKAWDEKHKAELKAQEQEAANANAVAREKALSPFKVQEAVTKATEEARAKRAIEDEDIDQAAASLVNNPQNTTLISQISSMRDDSRLRLFNKAQAIAAAQGKTFNPSDAIARQAVLKDFTDGKASDQLVSFNTFLKHDADLFAASSNFGRSNYTPSWVTKPLNYLEQHNSDPEISAYLARIEPVKDEYLSFLKNNRAALQEDVESMQNVVSGNMSPIQIQATTRVLADTARKRLDSLNSKYKRAFGRNYEGLNGGGLYDDEAAKALGVLDPTGSYGLKQQPSYYTNAKGQASGGTASPAQNHPQLSNIMVNAQGHQIGYDAASRTWRDVVTGQEVK